MVPATETNIRIKIVFLRIICIYKDKTTIYNYVTHSKYRTNRLSPFSRSLTLNRGRAMGKGGRRGRESVEGGGGCEVFEGEGCEMLEGGKM